jgi:anti-sigma factor RsiW
MDCKEFRELLDLYVDGELSPEATAAARVHLKECAACGRVEAQLLRLRRVLKHVATRHQPPPDLESAIRHALRRSPWRIPLLTRRQPDLAGQALKRIPFWETKVSLPAPVLMLLVAAVVAVGAWSSMVRRHASAPQRVSTEQRKTPVAPSTRDGFDLSRFDRGGRASIYKVRRASQDGGGQ